MRTFATDIESDVVDLSRCGLLEALALQDPSVTASLEALLGRLAEQPEIQAVGGGTDDKNEHFSLLCQGSAH